MYMYRFEMNVKHNTIAHMQIEFITLKFKSKHLDATAGRCINVFARIIAL